jgi:hypothetical protein
VSLYRGILNSPLRQAVFRYRIIKRRIAWLIGKWVSEQCASPQNPRVWEVLVHLLQEEGSGTDTVVHVTAAAALCDCVDVGLVSSPRLVIYS